MTGSPEDLAEFVATRLEAAAVPADAGPMAAYMKTDMPFYGVKKPARVPLYREMKRRFTPEDKEGYEAGVLALWAGPHREQKYAAIEYATQHRSFVAPASIELYERLVREGAWWDLVDGVASHLVGGAWAADRESISVLTDAWIEDPDMWIRRTAIIGQLRHKQRTDEDRLFRYCLARAHETEFFVRKAIGWALREYSRTAPDAVRTFLVAHRGELSGLSFREGAKRLVREGRMQA